MNCNRVSRFVVILSLLLFFSHSSNSQIYNSYYQKGLLSFTESTWDSAAYQWINKIKYTFAHNTNGTLSGETLNTWNSNLKKWIPSTQNIFKYNVQNSISEKYNQFRSAKSGKVSSSQKTKYTYKKNKLIEEQIFDIRNKNMCLIISMSRYDYDTIGRQINKITSKYMKKSFFTCATESCQYDTIGNLIKKEWESGCSGTDILSGVNTLEYDSLRRVVCEISKTLTSEKFQKTYKYKDDKIQKIKLQKWDAKDSLWCDNYIEFYLYNIYDDVIEKLQQVRNADNSKWINGRKTIYVYIPGRIIIAEIEQKWDEVNFCWFPVFKREYKWIDKMKN